MSSPRVGVREGLRPALGIGVPPHRALNPRVMSWANDQKSTSGRKTGRNTRGDLVSKRGGRV